MEMGYTAKNSKDSIVFSKTEILKSLREQKCTKSRKKRIATIQMESYEIPPKLDCRPSDDCNNILKALLGKENASAYEMDISEVVRPLPKIQPHRPKVVTKGVPDNNDVVGKIMEIMDTSYTDSSHLAVQKDPEDPCTPEKNKFSRHNLTVKNTKTGNASINAFVTKASNKRTIELHKTRRNISFAGKHMFSPVNIKNVKKSIKCRERYDKIPCIKCNHYYTSVKSLICYKCKRNEKDKPMLKQFQKQLVLLQIEKSVPKQRAHVNIINKAENKTLLKSFKMKYEVTNASSSMSRSNKHSQSKSQKTKSMSYISERVGSKKQRTLQKLHKSRKKSEEKRVFSHEAQKKSEEKCVFSHEAQDDCSIGNLDSNKSCSLYNFSKTKGHCDDSVHHVNPDHIVSYTMDEENKLISVPICSQKNEHTNDSEKNFSSYRECNNNFSDPCKKSNLAEKNKEDTVKEYRRSGHLKRKTDSQQKIYKSIVSVNVNEKKVKKSIHKDAVEKVAMKQNREVKPNDQADCLSLADHPCNGLDSKKLNLKDTYFSQSLHKKIGGVRNVVNDGSQKPVLQTINEKNITNPLVPEMYEKGVTVDFPILNSCRECTAPCVLTAQKSSFKEQSCKKSTVSSYVPISMAESEMHEETTMLELPSEKISGLEHNISQLETVLSNEVQESKLLQPKKVILKNETEDYKLNKSETFLGQKGNFAYHLSFNGMTVTCLDRNKDIDDFMLLLPNNKESLNSNEIEVVSLCDDSSDENFDGKEMENGAIPDSVDMSCTKDSNRIFEGTDVINEIHQCAFDSSNHMDETLNIKISNVCSVSEFIEPSSLCSEDSSLVISEINTKTSTLDGKYTCNSNVCSALDLAINEIVEYSVLSIMDLDYGIGNDVSSVKKTYEKTKAELLKHIKDDAILSKEHVQSKKHVLESPQFDLINLNNDQQHHLSKSIQPNESDGKCNEQSVKDEQLYFGDSILNKKVLNNVNGKLLEQNWTGQFYHSLPNVQEGEPSNVLWTTDLHSHPEENPLGFNANELIYHYFTKSD